MVIGNRNDGNSHNRNEEWQQGIGMGNGEQGTENGERGTGNGEIKRLVLFVNYND